MNKQRVKKKNQGGEKANLRSASPAHSFWGVNLWSPVPWTIYRGYNCVNQPFVRNQVETSHLGLKGMSEPLI